ncbi:SRPBCC family protein [Marinomonas sp. 2405UD68-3]|uniref:SRPBCC family protein n=1 Tax=Marinomonas sp. 2405UD68-3 TaxID=3391835 RepID=UPI0039C903E8
MEVKKSSALYQLRWVTRVLAVVILTVMAIGMLLPNKYHIERSIFINSPEERVSLYLADLGSWEQWMYLPNEGVFTLPEEEDSTASLIIKNPDADNGVVSIDSFEQAGVVFSVVTKLGVLPVSNHLSWAREGRGVRIVWVVEGELRAGLISPYLAFFANDIAGSNLEKSLENLKNKL